MAVPNMAKALSFSDDYSESIKELGLLDDVKQYLKTHRPPVKTDNNVSTSDTNPF